MYWAVIAQHLGLHPVRLQCHDQHAPRDARVICACVQPLAHPLVPERLVGSHRPGWNCRTNMGRMASSGHLGSIKNSTHGKSKAIFIFVAYWGDFHGEWRSVGTLRLDGRVIYSSDRFLLLLGPGSYLRDHFLLKSSKPSLAPTLNVSAVSHASATSS